jgi:hypothetical protein
VNLQQAQNIVPNMAFWHRLIVGKIFLGLKIAKIILLYIKL